jgi:hypothetical protein
VPGSYAIEVRDYFQDGTGTYSLHIQRLTDGQRCGDSMTCGVPKTTTLGANGKADTNLHSFAGIANDHVHVTLANGGGTNFSPQWRLVGPDGSTVCGWTLSDADCTLGPAGSYAVEVRDYFQDGTGTYTVQIQCLTEGQQPRTVRGTGTPPAEIETGASIAAQANTATHRNRDPGREAEQSHFMNGAYFSDGEGPGGPDKAAMPIGIAFAIRPAGAPRKAKLLPDNNVTRSI